MGIMGAMRKRKPMDLELTEAVLTLCGLVVVAFCLIFGAIAAIEWLLGVP